MERKTRYNGFRNYVTWCVHRWLTIDEGRYRAWRDEADRCRDQAPAHPNVDHDFWTYEEAARHTLARALREHVETLHPFPGEPLAPVMAPEVYRDLLDAALSEVHWGEIAESFLDDVTPRDGSDRDTQAPNHTASQPDAQPEATRFPLVQVVSTPGVLDAISPEEIAWALERHQRGDWGEVTQEDWRENETGLREGFRILSVYHSRTDVTFWIITEADRSATTILLPGEY